MKKYFILLFLVSGFLFSQIKTPEENRFQQSERAESPSPTLSSETDPNGPPNDNDAPIDDYIPVLFFVGVVVIALFYKQKEKNY